MSLKEQIAIDIDNIFFQIEDFAEIHKFEGKEIIAVVDSDSTMKVSEMLGIENVDYVVFFKTKDFKLNERIGAILNFDGKECTIESISENMGVTQVVLSQSA